MPNPNKYTRQDQRRVRRLYVEEELSSSEIAERTGISRYTVMRWARRGHYARSKSEAERLKWRRRHEDLWERAALLVERGWTYEQVAGHLGCSTAVPATAARRMDVEVPSAGERRTQIYREGKGPSGRKRKRLISRMATLRQAGQTLKAIGERFGFSGHWVGEMLKGKLSPMTP